MWKILDKKTKDTKTTKLKENQHSNPLGWATRRSPKNGGGGGDVLHFPMYAGLHGFDLTTCVKIVQLLMFQIKKMHKHGVFLNVGSSTNQPY